MLEKEPITSINHRTRTDPIDAERTLATPHFDAAAVAHARPAVPLAEIRARRSWPLALIALAVLAGLAGGVIGGVLATGYLRRAPAPSAVNTTEVAMTVAPTTAEQRPEEDEAVAHQAEKAIAMGEAQPSLVPGEDFEPQQPTESAELAEDADAERVPEVQSKGAQETLRSALRDWLAAINARNMSRQLSFYRPSMSAFYQRRNASLAVVRADRARVFERAHSISVRASDPSIRLSPDGRAATMLFRKRYAISGGGEDRSGEVLQELRWQRVKGEWKIISERDVRVVH